MTIDEAIKILNPNTNLNTLSFKDEQTAIEAVKTACFLACETLTKQRAEIKQIELRVLESFIRNMPKAYRKRTENWVVVKNILQTGGQTSCVAKCCELGIEPFGYTLERVKDD